MPRWAAARVVESRAASQAVKAALRPAKRHVEPGDTSGTDLGGHLGGLAVFARYDAATRSVQSTVQNTLPQVLCYVQSEPHLKSGTQTVGELGPDVLGHLSPDRWWCPACRSPANRVSRESPSTDTSFTWRCSTAAAPGPCLTRAERALRAAEVREPAARGTVPVARARVVKAVVKDPSPVAKREVAPITGP